jgi:surface protein
MDSMFNGASTFNQNISEWDTSKVTRMENMFESASAFNQDIGGDDGWDTTNVTDMSAMFRDATAFNQDISMWETDNVTDMGYMFRYAEAFNQSLGAWNVENVSDFNYMFDDTGLSIVNYDALLNGWSVQTLNVSDYFRASAYYSDAGLSARNILTDVYGWTITSDGYIDTNTPDTVAPTIILLGDATVTITQGEAYVDAGAIGKDDRDGAFAATVISNDVDVHTAGTYTIVYSAADLAGNTASSTETRTVIIE